MKYDHTVKYNGIYYPAGEDVPNKTSINKEVVEKTPLPFSDEDIVLETKEDAPIQYSKTDINTMKTADLQNLALSVGIEGAEEMTGGTLKKLLVERFGL